MKVSVMFITHNRKKELLRALESCVNQKNNEVEIIVFDNRSTDGTQHMVKTYLEQVRIPYKYYYSDVNLGISQGRNLAFNMCEGEYVLCLDDDAILDTNNFFEILYNEMQKDLLVAAASVEIYEPESKIYLNGVRHKDGKYALSYIGAAHVLKTACFKGEDLYPADMTFGSEEYYVAYRIFKKDLKMLHIDSLRVLHLPSEIARVRGIERKMNIIVNNYIIRKLCYPKIVIPILYFFFVGRIIKYKFYTKTHLQQIQEMIKKRYKLSYEDRMSIYQFLKMNLKVGMFNVF